MTAIENTELRDFQRTVKAAAESMRGTAIGASTYVDQFLASVGLDNFVDDVQVCVTVTVPASDAAAAAEQVQSQISGLYLPTGWSATVTA